MTTRADIVAEARRWLGTPFLHQGRTRGVGVDCVGLLIGVARALGLVAPELDVTGYPRTPQGNTIVDRCGEHLPRLELAEAQPGDVLVVRIDVLPQHAGILADYRYGGLSIIHALDQRGRHRGSVVEHRLDPGLAARAVAAYRLA